MRTGPELKVISLVTRVHHSLILSHSVRPVMGTTPM
jgi:hypothetical protein